MTEQIYGRRPVREALRASRRSISSIRLVDGAQPSEILDEILSRAGSMNIPIQSVQRDTLDREAEHHQGVAAQVDPYPYGMLDDLLPRFEELKPFPFLVVLDQIQDPRNFGAILRTAEAVGVHAVLIPSHRSSPVTHTVVSASAGASEHLLIIRSNIVKAMQRLQERGMWFAGLDNDPQATALEDFQFEGALGLVIGSEGRGMRRLVRESCDFLVRIPMAGRIGSLNASVAASIAMYTLRSRRGAKK
jgi:23S rRNA (guanosine2251-2'-O)-methyltransferase